MWWVAAVSVVVIANIGIAGTALESCYLIAFGRCFLVFSIIATVTVTAAATASVSAVLPLQPGVPTVNGVAATTATACFAFKSYSCLSRPLLPQVPLEEIAVVGRLVHAHFALLMDRVLQQQQHQHWPYQQSSIFKYDGIACRNSPL